MSKVRWFEADLGGPRARLDGVRKILFQELVEGEVGETGDIVYTGEREVPCALRGMDGE